MKWLYLNLAVIILLLLAGCARETSTPASTVFPTSTLMTVTSEPLPSNTTPVLDKFSLWIKGTQLRGVNVYQRFVYPDVWDEREIWGDGPLGPVFTQEDFGSLAAAGANFVVLSLPGLYDEKPPYNLNLDVQANLDKFIGMAAKADLFVVIAFRTGPGRSEFSFLEVGKRDRFGRSHINNDVWKDQSAQDKWAEMWRYTAARYRDNPVVVGYELMVEPNSNGIWLDISEPADFYPEYQDTTYDWNQLYPRISRAIREVDSTTPILIGGMGWSAVNWLPYLQPTGDRRTVYTVHQYEPQDEYTHQEPDATGNYPNTYPGRFDTNGDGVVEDFNKTWIQNWLAPVDEFKKKYNVPTAVTEYGIMRWQPGAAGFIDDEMSIFERSGVNYAIWSWQPVSPVFTAMENEFNFRLGPDPSDLTENNSEIYNTLKKYWAKNGVRPSDFK